MFENGSSAVGRWACGEDSDATGSAVTTLVSLVVSVTDAFGDGGGMGRENTRLQ